MNRTFRTYGDSIDRQRAVQQKTETSEYNCTQEVQYIVQLSYRVYLVPRSVGCLCILALFVVTCSSKATQSGPMILRILLHYRLYISSVCEISVLWPSSHRTPTWTTLLHIWMSLCLDETRSCQSVKLDDFCNDLIVWARVCYRVPVRNFLWLLRGTPM